MTLVVCVAEDDPEAGLSAFTVGEVCFDVVVGQSSDELPEGLIEGLGILGFGGALDKGADLAIDRSPVDLFVLGEGVAGF